MDWRWYSKLKTNVGKFFYFKNFSQFWDITFNDLTQTEILENLPLEKITIYLNCGITQ
jgi:hypothetical protein